MKDQTLDISETENVLLSKIKAKSWLDEPMASKDFVSLLLSLTHFRNVRHTKTENQMFTGGLVKVNNRFLINKESIHKNKLQFDQW